MNFYGKRIGFCYTGSFCTLDNVYKQMLLLIEEGADIYPIFSYSVATMDTRFTKAADFRNKVENATGKKIINTIVDAEPIGPKLNLDIVVIAPCTGNTLAKLINGITDTPVTMAAKAQLRNQRPVVLSLSTNDALGNNGRNIGAVVNTKNIFVTPFYQDGPYSKYNSITADLSQLPDTISMALNGKQKQPIIVQKN